MNLCVYCKLVNSNDSTTCINCGYDLQPTANYNYKYVKLIDKLKEEITMLKKSSYHAYSNWTK